MKPLGKAYEILFSVLYSKTSVPLRHERSSRRNLLRATLVADAGNQKDGLIYLAQLSRSNFCTDPRDRIYSMLSLCLDDLAKSRPQLDYTKTEQEIYLELALKNLHYYNELLFLGSCDYQPLPGSPTWVPNWSTPVTVLSFFAQHAGPLAGKFQYLEPGPLTSSSHLLWGFVELWKSCSSNRVARRNIIL
jgi:hypothetical protein